MAQAVAAIVIKAAGASLSTGAAAAITAAAAVTDIALTASYQKKQESDARKAAAAAPRDVMVRSAIEPSKIVYGRARVSGPVVYTNTKPTPGTNDNNTLWTVVSLASHECDDIEAIYLDGDRIPSSIIDWAGTGGVTSGTYGPISGNEVTNFYRRLGSDTQSYVSQLASAFSDWTTSHVGKGTCYVVSAFELGTRTGEGVWSNGAPQSIRAVVKGKKVYDPRQDSTNGGSGTHRLADPTTWEWSDNPALCLADYLFDADLGMGAEGVAYADIDWAMVATAADQCDATVTVPSGGSTKRFSCNGVLDTGTAYADNIRALLSSMAGTLTWSGGKYRIRAAAYEAPTYTFTENDIVGDVQVQPERPRAQRFNTVRGTFVDPSEDYAATQFLRVQDSDYLSTRDDGQELTTSIALPMTNDQYMAQRLAWRSLRLNNQQTTAVVPLNWKALKVGVGDRINLTVSELSWSSKVFVVDAWSFDPEKGFMLTVREDSASAYTDPALGDYSTRTAAGTIVFNDPAVPSPSGLTATSEEEGILLEWQEPSMPSMYDEVVIYASPDSAWANAVEVGRVRGTRFRHELERGTQRYYWVRSEDVDGRESIRDPDSDTSSIQATAGQIATSQLDDDANFAETAVWSSVTGDGRPEDDATVGATVGTNLFDTDGTTVLGTTDVINSVLAQEILNVELENETILDLETGLEVDIQNLGDVAIFVNESNTTLNTRIDANNNALSNLQNTVVDLTSGVSDVFLQATEPVAGVGGIPDPIPTFSRWYDTDDNNAPYYWDGSAWQSLEDPRIGQNATSITSLSTRMSTAEGDIDANTAAAAANASAAAANASAISTLDTTVVAQGDTIAVLSTSNTELTATLDFITKVEDEADQEPIDLESTGELDLETLDDVTSATSTAIQTLEVQTTAISGTISTQATQIAQLESVLSVDGEFSATVNAVETLGTRITSNDDDLETVAGQISALQNTVNNEVTGVEATATAVDGLSTRVTSAEGNITANADAILAVQGILQDPDGNFSASANAVQTFEVVLANEGGTFSASSNAITEINSTVGDNSASITTQAESIDGLEAQYTVKIDNNGRVSGFGLASTAADATPFSEFVVIADQFSVVDPASTASTPIIPFQISGGKALFTSDVEINGDLITTGTITATRLNLNGTMFTAPSGVLTIANGGVGSDQLASGSVDIAKFSSGLQPIQVVGSLPSSASEGDQAYLTTDNKLYRYDGAAWIKAVDGADVSSGTLPATAIVANSITAGQIQAGAISATEISVTNLAAINSDLGTLTAGTIDASVVTVSNISASNISTGTLDASTVTVSNLNASNITAGSLNADRLSIDGVTLDTSAGNLIIATGGVDTTQIASNAVSGIEVDFNSSTTAITVTNSLSSGYNTANREAQVTITTEGGPVDLVGAFEFAASAFYTNQYTGIQMWLYRVSGGTPTLIYSTYNPYMDKNLGLQLSVNYVDTPAAGTYTYELHIGRAPSYTVYGRYPYLRALELKR